MVFRLFKPNRKHFPARAAMLGAFSVLASCGSDQFTATSTSGTGQAGAGGGAEQAGAADDAGEAGEATGGAAAAGSSSGGASAGSTSSAGSGGKASAGCSCPAGSYCEDGTTSCRSCAEFSQFSFTAPEKLAALSQNTSGNERFPRAGVNTADLFYRAGSDAASVSWYAPAPVSGTGHALLSSAPGDSGPLYAPRFSPPQNFFFDRLNALGMRQIMAGTWLDGALTNVIVAPPPINGGTQDFSVAVAADVRRAYWMTTRNQPNPPDLVWAEFGSSATAPAVLDVEVQAGAGTCPRLGSDATPWVNAAGTLLLFRSESVNTNCRPNDSGAYDLFASPLAKNGKPLAAAVALSTLNNTGGSRSESDPSLSVDSCTIYFASDDGEGNFELYRASRN